jgi:hypothetical protein
MSEPVALEWRSDRRPQGRPSRSALVAIGAAFVTGVLVAKGLEWLALTRAYGR